MQKRRIGAFEVLPIAFGGMNLGVSYSRPPSQEDAEAVLLRALDLGVDHFDTAALYGFGVNESLFGRVLSPHRSRFMLASKCGITAVDGKRVIDGHPRTLKRTCEEALKRLRTEVIDLYYLHRWDKKVPIEESVGALGDLVREGKIRSVGLSEVSAVTLRRAHAEHPITAVQSEYSLWTRNPEIAVLDACRDLGIAFVAFSPNGRGFLSGALRTLADIEALEASDLRLTMPRFHAENFAANLRLLDGYLEIARQVGCTPAQLALAWVLARGEHILALPGTARIDHLEENLGASDVSLSAETLLRLDTLINQQTVRGGRYSPASQSEVDTEVF